MTFNIVLVPEKIDKYKILFDQHFEVEIGDIDSVDFKPKAKIKRWGEECYLELELVKLSDTKKVNKVKPFKEIDNNKEKLKWKDNDKEIHFYPLTDGFEYEIILNKKPDSNITEFNIQTKGLVFYYQPELTQLELDIDSIRPDNVIGSYAAYHATKTNLHTNKEDAEKYKCGKAFHIYRPKVIDTNENWIWADLNIDMVNNKMTITILQSFLDNAIYPIRIDPDFGYTTVGGTLIAFSVGADVKGSKYTGAAGTLNSMSVYLHDNSPNPPTWADLGGSQNFQVAIYKDSDNTYVDNIGDFAVSSNAFQTQTFPAVQQTISAVDYWLYVAYTDAGGFGDYVFAAYDSGGSGRETGWGQIGGAWPATLAVGDFNNTDAFKYSIYGTYTPSGGGISVAWLTA